MNFIPNNVRQLALAVLAGVDCKYALHDALLEAGFTKAAHIIRTSQDCKHLYKMLTGETIELPEKTLRLINPLPNFCPHP